MPKANLSANSGENTDVKTKPKKKKTVLIIIMLIILAGSAAGAYSYFNQQAAESVVKKKAPSSAKKEVLDMGEMVVNLSGNGGSHYLRVKIVLEYPENKKLKEELNKKKHMVSDVIITTLRAKTFTDVSSSNAAQALKDSIIEEINSNLEYGDITGVYFTDFLIQ